MEKAVHQGAPRLQAPGAGLPFLEYLVAKHYYVKWYSRNVAWEKSVETFMREGERILGVVGTFSSDQLAERKLIDRIPGIEDSSRFWSIAMTAEHLMIVGSGVARAMEIAGSGKEVPGQTPTIAQVKPKGLVDAKLLAGEFRAFLERYRETVEKRVENRDSAVRFCHPWFGPMTIRQWNWLMATHQRTHRKQIELIARQLRS